uniref:Uncharacterized protein n=1 Tax=Arundo donax TaxID=35708 RepID=A0A0A9EWC1_ARUDO
MAFPYLSVFFYQVIQETTTSYMDSEANAI